MTEFEPLHDRLLVRRDPNAANALAGTGLEIPESAKEKPQQGTVISAGPGRVADNGVVRPLGVKAGDRVLFGKYSGTEIKLDGEEFLIMREEEVLGRVKQKGEDHATP